MDFSVMSMKNNQHWFLHLLQKCDSKVVRSKYSRRGVVLDEIICIKKGSTSAALVVLTAEFPSDSLKDEKIEARVVGVVGRIEH
ncbi:hypothetical protein KY285_024210 [Solanum tuberosum]|nr:hypothetical protein KY289_024548 [Solanum tuberosum]KAH0673199.1 hypothetical protein KY284_024286 [Solanum tuberosum]KAH0676409.1 hypothetical protein KY285_024210 [Solanum tuberosum]